MRGDFLLPDSPDDYAIFTVTGIPGSLAFPSGTPGYFAAPYQGYPCYLIHGSPGDPVAWLNRSEDCIDIVASESLAWGAVKRLW